MDLIIPFCGAAKTSIHNQVMLEGVKSAMLSGKNTTSGGVSKHEIDMSKYRGWSDEERKVGSKFIAFENDV
jgi:homoserine O-acetyltransferase